jgi:hypothetical protein
VMVVEDEPGQPSTQMIEQAVHLHAEIAKLAGSEPDAADENVSNLSFLLAGSLPLDLDFKQNLLTTLSEEKRLEAVIQYLRAVLPGLRRASKARWN